MGTEFLKHLGIALLALSIFSSSPSMAEMGHSKMDHSNMKQIPKTGKSGKKMVFPTKQDFRTENLKLTRKGHLVDQNGNHRNLSDYKGKLVLMDFIYTGCKYGHCAYLNNKMKYVYKKFKKNVGVDIQFVSITFDPEVDSPEVLKKYSSKWESDPSKWAFLTGEPGDIVDLAKEYGVVFSWDKQDKTYNHSMRTVLLNRSGETVKIYRGMDYKLNSVVKDIKALLK